MPAPALLKSTPTSPKRSYTSAHSCTTHSRSLTSTHCDMTAVSPLDAVFATMTAASASLVSSQSTRQTFMPSDAHLRAAALPRPAAAPVTTAVRPAEKESGSTSARATGAASSQSMPIQRRASARYWREVWTELFTQR